VAGLCEKFLEDAERNLEPRTYRIYQYSCQKFVDHLGRRMAHTITPTDISSFANSLKKSLNTARQPCGAWSFAPFDQPQEPPP
jgi:hypothetical protein